MRRWLITVFCIGALLLALAVFVGLPLLNQKINSSLAELAAARGVAVKADALRLGFGDISANQLLLSGRSAGWPWNISFDQPRVNYSWMALLSGRASLKITTKLYGGSLDGAFAAPLTKQSMNGHVSLSGLNLDQQPELNLMGIRAGKLNIVLSDLDWRGGSWVDSGQLNAAISELKLVPQLTRLGRGVKFNIPDLEIPGMEMRCRLSPQTMECGEVTGTSNLGTLSGTFSLAGIGRQGFETMLLNLDIALTALGSETIGPWLPLLSNNRVSQEQGLINLKVSGGLNRPQIVVTAY